MLAFSVVDSAHRQTDLVSRHREGWEALVAELEAPAEGSIQDVRLGILGRVLTRRVDPRVLVSPGCTRTIPFPHQVATCHRVINHMDGRAILADEVGLGKTIEAGMILTEYLFRGEANRVLVITPAGLTTQWQDELLDKFNLTFPIVDGRSGVGMVEGVKGHPRLITSLPFAKRPEVRGAFSEISWDLVIVDEAHHLRNPTTLNHRFVQSLSAKRLLLLTATPLQNSLTELFTLVDLVSPHIVDGSDLPKRLNRSIPPEDVVALRRALSGVMLRNRRCEVAGKGRLPPRTARTLRVRLSGSGKELYDAVSRYAVKGYRKSVASKHSAFGFFLMGIQRMLTSSVEALVGSLKRRIKKLKMHLGVRQKDLVKIREFLPEWETGKPVSKRIRRQLEKEIETLEGLVRLAGKVERHPKKSALLRYLRKLFREEDARVLIFTEFLGTQEMLAQVLRQEGWETEIFRGGMTIKEKNDTIERFESGKILISTEAGSEGRNLQFAHIVVNYDLPWNPMKLEQRIGRVHRLGQKKEVQVINLTAAGTVEDHLLRVLDKKLGLFTEMVGDLETILGILSPEGSPEKLVMEAFVKGYGKPGGLSRFQSVLGDSVEKGRKSLTHTLSEKGIDLRPPHADQPSRFPTFEEERRVERAFRAFLDKYNGLLDEEGSTLTFKMPYFLSIDEENLFSSEARRGTFSQEEALAKPWLDHLSVTHPFLLAAMAEAPAPSLSTVALTQEQARSLSLPHEDFLFLPVRISWKVGPTTFDEVVSVVATEEEAVVRPDMEEEVLWLDGAPVGNPSWDFGDVLERGLKETEAYVREEAHILEKGVQEKEVRRIKRLEARVEEAMKRISTKVDKVHQRITKTGKPDTEEEENSLRAKKRRRARWVGERASLAKKLGILRELRKRGKKGGVHGKIHALGAVRVILL